MGSWSNPFGSSVFADIPFFAFLTLHRRRKRFGQKEEVWPEGRGLARVKLYMHMKLKICSSKFFFLQKYHFGLFIITMMTISGFLAHV